MKRTFTTILVVLLLATTLVVPAYANSAQTHWRGVDSTGAVIMGENCPIEVTKEVLTFDISECLLSAICAHIKRENGFITK